LKPELIICDDRFGPDVSVQAQVVNLLQEPGRIWADASFISHGLAVVEHISDRVAVMYLEDRRS
jgi:ABC-type oligopeptide transport system ATPase subunit